MGQARHLLAVSLLAASLGLTIGAQFQPAS